MEAPQQGPPDFGVISDSFHAIGHHMQRLANLPAVDGGVAILKRLDRLQQDTLDFHAEMRETLIGLRDEISGLRASMSARYARGRTTMRPASANSLI